MTEAETQRPPEKEINPPPEFQVKYIDDFTPRELYQALALRFNVFVLEQQSIFPEYDEHDLAAAHIYLEEEGTIIAYARAYRAGGTKAKFGRVAVAKEHRGRKLGRKIVEKTLEEIRSWANISLIEIEAQEYLIDFYSSFGFRQTSEPFDDGGVMHVAMELEVG